MSRPVDPGGLVTIDDCRLSIVDCRLLKPFNRKSKIENRKWASERGIALLIVVSVLTVISIMAVAFAFSMYLETQATRQFVAMTQARYIAEAGVNHAWGLLDEDRRASRIDELMEGWKDSLAGSDVDVNGDGMRESRWYGVNDNNEQLIGRYALIIQDESSKAHLGVALAHPSSTGTAALNLTTLLQEADIDNPAQLASTIEQYRYGSDTRPGVALIDDDRDGIVDEVDEYESLGLRGDDRRIDSLEDLVAVANLSPEELSRLAELATVYSKDMNVSMKGQTRINVNTATVDELFSVLLEAGVDDPWQSALNITDYVDKDVDISRLSRSSQEILLSDEGPKGSWEWEDDHYETDDPAGSPLSYSVGVSAGTFYVRALGVSEMPVGHITINGAFHPSVESGTSLGQITFTDTATVSISHTGTGQGVCAFKGLELVPNPGGTGTILRGIEAIRINEIMVEPVLELQVDEATFDTQNSDWVCSTEQSVCTNSGVGQGRWSWIEPQLSPGRYHVRVYGSAGGQTVGEVSIDGDSELLLHGERHPNTVLVGSDKKLTLTIGKTASGGTYYMQRVSLSLQPDGEYVEFINLTDDPVDMSGWMLDGDAIGGRQARLPSGSVIEPHGLLLAVVDWDDTQSGLDNNGVDAQSAWGISSTTGTIVQLEFPSGAPSADDDWIKASMPPDLVPRLTLTYGDMTVDEVEYPLPLSTTVAFQSLEKGDPTAIIDSNDNGIDDGWAPSLELYTPSQPNNNDDLKSLEGEDIIVHDPRSEIRILNRALGYIGELVGLSSGKAWKQFSSTDLAKIVDRFTVQGLPLEAEDHLIDGQDVWHETEDGYAYSSPGSGIARSGAWQWTGIPDGPYRVSLYGWANEQFSVRWHLQEETTTEWSPALSSDAQGRIVIGQIVIGSEAGTPSSSLTLEVNCASPSGICHMDHVQLDPQLQLIGAINVNTAPLSVLRTLPGMTDALSGRIISGRPYGDQNQQGRGIGDLLMGDTLGTTDEERLAAFRQFGHLLTTRSDLFRIMSLGQAIDDGEPMATQGIQTIVQRGATTDEDD